MTWNSTFKPSAKPMKPKKLRKCCMCKTSEVANVFAKLCTNIDCVIAYGNRERDKRIKKENAKIARAERERDRERKEKLKSLNDWKKELEALVNKYVRLRDKDLPCISCDRSAYWDGQWHASHYKSVGSNSALRYNLWNIHKSCSICNNWKSGNIGEYTPRLIEKIGADRVDWLNSHPRMREYDIEWIKRAKSIFSRKIKRLERRG